MTNSTSAFRSPFPIITCSDVRAALRFYREHLGFQPTYRFPDEGEALFVALTLDGAALGLTSSDFEPLHGRSPGASSSGFELCVTTDDVDAAVESLGAAGVPIPVAPTDQPWGERVAYVTDPDEHLVMITGPAGA